MTTNDPGTEGPAIPAGETRNARTIDASFDAAWARHAAAESAEPDPTRLALLRARRAVAERYPGCARAILSDNPMLNWDRGQLVKNA